MSAREIIAELPRLTAEELRAVEEQIAELTARGLVPRPASLAGSLRAERVAGRLRLAGPRMVLQAEVEAILDEFP